jgi:hypothetical protein
MRDTQENYESYTGAPISSFVLRCPSCGEYPTKWVRQTANTAIGELPVYDCDMCSPTGSYPNNAQKTTKPKVRFIFNVSNQWTRYPGTLFNLFLFDLSSENNYWRLHFCILGILLKVGWE